MIIYCVFFIIDLILVNVGSSGSPFLLVNPKPLLLSYAKARIIMAYSTGMMNKRVTVAKRATDTQESFGKAGQPKYEILGTFWMSETFNKGVKSLREGAMDAYDTVMFRCRFNKDIDRWCLLKFNGKWYQIQSFNEDYQENQIQMTAIEMANQKVTIVEPYNPSSSEIGAEIHVGDL